MTVHYMIRWLNPNARGSVDIIRSDLFSAREKQVGLSHATIYQGEVLTSKFDLVPQGKALVFRYGGDHAEANKNQGIYRGDMRLLPAVFLGSSTLEWRDEGVDSFVPLPVRVSVIEGVEGERKERSGTYLRRDASLALAKRADAMARGQLRCNACGYAGLEAYGSAAAQTFEVHHKEHLADGERKTTMEDLILLCCNCHRAIHALNVGYEDFSARFR